MKLYIPKILIFTKLVLNSIEMLISSKMENVKLVLMHNTGATCDKKLGSLINKNKIFFIFNLSSVLCFDQLKDLN